MTVRAKYSCVEITKSKHYSNKDKFLYTAKFNVVTSGSKENDMFFEFTPTGNIQIGTYTEDFFEIGKDYYVDFTKAELQ